MAEQFIRMIIKGEAKNIHERFPITFDYGQSGTAYFNGCRVESTEQRGQVEITNRMDVQAFGAVAEELASVVEGSIVHLEGSYGQRKGRDEKWYPVVTIDKVISIA